MQTGFSVPLSSSCLCRQSNGLESLGLADIRILVRLMTLAAGGRAQTCVDGQSGGKGPATEHGNSSCLSFLTAAIGSVVSHSVAAYRQLVEICTQVSFSAAFLCCTASRDYFIERIEHVFFPMMLVGLDGSSYRSEQRGLQ